MALELNLSYSQSNDAKKIVFTDSTGAYDAVDNDTGWGAPNAEYTDIVAGSDTVNAGSETHLLLRVSVTDKSNTSVTYDDINLYDVDSTGAFASLDELTWTLDASNFVSGGTAMGTSDDLLTDGIWDITYLLVDNDDHSSIVDSLNQKVLVDGEVRIVVFDKLREIPKQYDCEDSNFSREIMESLLSYSYLKSMEASATISEDEDLVTMLWTLNKMISDGSNYTW